MRAIRGDITELDVDAIVNAANESLLGGGGVDGAIHRAAGPELLRECRGLGGCPTGEARITGGYALPAKRVIHTVGPIWGGGEEGEPALLARAYRSSLELALEEGLRSVAFPHISTGVYGFPKDLACRIAVDVAAEFEAREPALSLTFVSFDEGNHQLYQERLAKGRFLRGSYLGCLLGGAAGDALGAPVEFDSIEEIRERHGERGVEGYVELPGGRGMFTDDTQMTLFTAEGLLRARAPLISSVTRLRGGSERQLLWDSYRRWLLTQGVTPEGSEIDEIFGGSLLTVPGLFRRRAPGQTCLDALIGGRPGSTAAPLNYSKGSGGVMRAAPAGLLLPGEAGPAFDLGAEVAALTHGHPSGFLAAGHLAATLALLLGGERLEVAIAGATALLRARPEHEECLRAVEAAVEAAARDREAGEAPTPEKVEALGAGWVAEEALSIALYCALSHPADLRAGLLAAVHHGGDSDSTASIAGQLLGLMLGEQALPAPWREGLGLAELVSQVAADLFAASFPLRSSPDPEWWRRYPSE